MPGQVKSGRRVMSGQVKSRKEPTCLRVNFQRVVDRGAEQFVCERLNRLPVGSESCDLSDEIPHCRVFVDVRLVGTVCEIQSLRLHRSNHDVNETWKTPSFATTPNQKTKTIFTKLTFWKFFGINIFWIYKLKKVHKGVYRQQDN